jgi:hypothetical protein
VTGKPFSGGNPLPAMIAKIKESSNFEQRKSDIEKFNQVSMSRLECYVCDKITKIIKW